MRFGGKKESRGGRGLPNNDRIKKGEGEGEGGSTRGGQAASWESGGKGDRVRLGQKFASGVGMNQVRT